MYKVSLGAYLIAAAITVSTAPAFAASPSTLTLSSSGILNGTYNFNNTVLCKPTLSIMPQAPSDFASANQTNIDVGTITFTPLPTLNSYAGAPQSGYVQIVTIGTNDPNASTGTISILNNSLTYSKETQYGSYYYAGNALSLNINGKAPQLFFVLYGASSASGFAGQAEMYSSFLTNSGLFSCTQVQALTSNN